MRCHPGDVHLSSLHIIAHSLIADLVTQMSQGLRQTIIAPAPILLGHVDDQIFKSFQGEPQAFFQTGAHAPGVWHHCGRRIPRDYARKRAQGTTVLPAFDYPMPLSVQYVNRSG